MATHTSEVVPPFDFTAALRYTPEERMQLCVDRVRDRLHTDGVLDLFDLPPVPNGGASEAELQTLEVDLGVLLPVEYGAFLRRWRYLIIDCGQRVWGFDHDGVSIGRPWVSDEHRANVRYLVFADYWRYADGDQLLIELDHSQGPVFAS